MTKSCEIVIERQPKLPSSRRTLFYVSGSMKGVWTCIVTVLPFPNMVPSVLIFYCENKVIHVIETQDSMEAFKNTRVLNLCS